MDRDLGSVLVVVGGLVVVAGVLLRLGLLDWFGRLPGDIRIDDGSSRVFVPITSSIVASVVLSVVLSVVSRLRG